jgi:putative sigma-54 modulation protein
MYASIDAVIDKLERQIRKNKTKLGRRIHQEAFVPDNFQIDEQIEEENSFKIMKSKRFAIKPMDVEEAILQMNLLGHNFFVFSNSETEEVNVVYKRKDGNYGLIEPEF